MIPVYIGVAIFALAGYFIFIPPFGVWGASGMTVATELAITLGSFLIVWRATRIGMRFSVFLRSLLASIVMLAVLFFARDAHILISLLLGGSVYVAALLLFRGVRKSDMQELLRLR